MASIVLIGSVWVYTMFGHHVLTKTEAVAKVEAFDRHSPKERAALHISYDPAESEDGSAWLVGVTEDNNEHTLRVLEAVYSVDKESGMVTVQP